MQHRFIPADVGKGYVTWIRQGWRWVYIFLTVLLLSSSGFTSGLLRAQLFAAPAGSLETPGLVATQERHDGQSTIVVRSPGRFQLHFAASGIVAWYDLRRDPATQTNLVQPGGPLLAFRQTDENSFAAAPALLNQSNVRVQVVFASQTVSLTYTVWAGGQVAVKSEGAAMVQPELRRVHDAITGAVLEQVGAQRQAWLLFLDAWTAEGAGLHTAQWAAPPAQARQSAPASLVLRDDGALLTDARSAMRAEIVVPSDMGLRQPRFVLANWPGAQVAVQRGATSLVAGQDYLAAWDSSSGELAVQYLQILPVGGTATERRFVLEAQPTQTNVLSLGIAGRNVDENGFLIVDANLPNASGATTISDTFRIPYIQSTPTVTATAVHQGSAAGVEFVLNGERRVIPGAPGQVLQAGFVLPRRGEYRLEGYLVDANGNRLSATPNDTIEPLGYGWIFSTIGDSITSGKFGGMVGPPGTSFFDPRFFPVTSYATSPEFSSDRRNFFQMDNFNQPDYFYRGYQTPLNDLLTSCSQAPVFVLNDGFSGARTASFFDINRTLTAKMPAFNDHIQRLGVQHVLLIIGTNDATARTPAQWTGDLNAVIDALQTPNPGLTTWVGRIPWRNDNVTFQNAVAAFNAQIPGIVASQNTALNPVREGPDFYSYFQQNPTQLSPTDPSGQPDNLHPTRVGFDGMANLWASQDFVCGALPRQPPTGGSGEEPTPPPDEQPTAMPTAAPQPTATPPAANPSVEQKVLIPLVQR